MVSFFGHLPPQLPALGFWCSSITSLQKETLCLTENFKAEMENVKSFTRTNNNKPDFTPRKARKSRNFWHFKPTKQNLWGFLWWINVDKLSIHGIFFIGSYLFCTHLPKNCLSLLIFRPFKLFTPTGQFFYTDKVISVTFCNSGGSHSL